MDGTVKYVTLKREKGETPVLMELGEHQVIDKRTK